MLRQPRPNAYETTQVHDGGEHHMLNGELLEAMQQGLTSSVARFRETLGYNRPRCCGPISYAFC